MKLVKTVFKDKVHAPGYVEGIPGLKSCPYVPYDPQERYLFNSYLGAPHANGAQPWEYTGWKDECWSWHETCYIHANLNPHPTVIIKGPDAMKLVSDFCVNTTKEWAIGRGKHLILCNEDGLVINDGIGVRIAEDAIKGHELSRLAFEGERGDYDVTIENVTSEECIFQFCGPRALEIIENVVREDIHDLKFMYTRVCHVLGKKVGILRAGMAGSLGYEIHCQVEDAIEIYNEAIRVGKAYGLRKLGSRAYAMTHYEGGFPQWSLDFISPVGDEDDKLFKEYLTAIGIPAKEPAGTAWCNEYSGYEGSMGSDPAKRTRNPYELGWGGMVKFDHEFRGRAALEKIKADPKRKMVTLVWNKDDIMDIYRSQYEKGEPYMDIDNPLDFKYEGPWTFHADKVLDKDGREVGISTGRMNCFYYREMISLCSLNLEYCQLGTEVKVVWGNPGTRQKEIRAVVSRYPFLSEERNESVDVNTIPRYCAK